MQRILEVTALKSKDSKETKESKEPKKSTEAKESKESLESQKSLTLRIMPDEYKLRRQKLLNALPTNSLVILKGANLQYRNHDCEYPFRQNSDFYYLCGFTEPSALLILRKSSSDKSEFILFCLPNNAEAEIWTGKRAGLEAAISDYGADHAYDIEDLDKMMPGLMQEATQCFYSLGKDKNFDARVLTWMDVARSKTRKGGEYPHIWQDISPLLHEFRLIKSESEIALMQKSADISVDAHLHLMKICQSNKMEYQLEGEYINACMQQGARFQAYSPIVGAGMNSCVLHYTANNQILPENEILLVDAGCEYQYYASDITRSYPISGRFSKEQKQIYELVLQAQEAAIQLVAPKTRWDALQNKILEILVSGLVELKILNGDVAKLISDKAYLPFYMHSSGHWLGLDVHDAGAYKIKGEWRALEPGMVLTVEPGLYFAKNCPADKKWWGIGVRIEDDVLVTANGHRVLTAKLPKTVETIEAVMRA